MFWLPWSFNVIRTCCCVGIEPSANKFLYFFQVKVYGNRFLNSDLNFNGISLKIGFVLTPHVDGLTVTQLSFSGRFYLWTPLLAVAHPIITYCSCCFVVHLCRSNYYYYFFKITCREVFWDWLLKWGMAYIVDYDEFYTHRHYTVNIHENEIKVTVTAVASVIRRWISTTLFLFRRRYLQPNCLVAGLDIQWTPRVCQWYISLTN